MHKVTRIEKLTDNLEEDKKERCNEHGTPNYEFSKVVNQDLDINSEHFMSLHNASFGKNTLDNKNIKNEDEINPLIIDDEYETRQQYSFGLIDYLQTLSVD